VSIPFPRDGQSTRSLTIRECPIPSEATHGGSGTRSHGGCLLDSRAHHP
jgi:hypothetical protein